MSIFIRKKNLLKIILKTYAILSLFSHNALSQKTTVKVLVYGATPAGIMAAISAAREGASVLLIEPSKHIGGMYTSGLSTAETEHMIEETISGIPSEFFKNLGRFYGKNEPQFYFESHIAERIFLQMLEKEKVPFFLNMQLIKVKKKGNKIIYAKFSKGKQIKANVFIDASYEGDLMAKAGVSYTWGRENKNIYQESLAGIRFEDNPILLPDGIPLKDSLKIFSDFTKLTSLKEGRGDRKVMNYNFRLIFSTKPDRVHFYTPTKYKASNYILLKRWLIKHPNSRLSDILDLYHWIPNDKIEVNDKQNAIISLGYIGGNTKFPNSSFRKRKKIINAHKQYTIGLLYFLSTDSTVPPAIREEINKYGFDAEEFKDNKNFPYLLYVREGRRMIGNLVQTQHDIFENRTKPDAVALGSHWIDCHYVQRVAVSHNEFVNEGRIWIPIRQPYEISYRTITPKKEECINLLVPVCVSASHVAFCSIRVESTWMQLGNAAGIASSIASKLKCAVQDVPIEKIQEELNKQHSYYKIDQNDWSKSKKDE